MKVTIQERKPDMSIKMTLDFSEIKKDDVLTAGGKGANLGEMTAAGITVPGGFVVTAEVYRAFLKENTDKQLQNGFRYPHWLLKEWQSSANKPVDAVPSA